MNFLHQLVAVGLILSTTLESLEASTIDDAKARLNNGVLDATARFLESANSAEIVEYAGWLLETEDVSPPLLDAAWYLLFIRWAEADPESGFATALGHGRGLQYFRIWYGLDPVASLEAIKSSDLPTLTGAVSYLAESDQEGALALALSTRQASVRKPLLDAWALSVVAADPASVRQLIQMVRDPSAQTQVRRAVLTALAAAENGESSKVLFSLLLDEPPGTPRIDFAYDAVRRWGKSDPEAASAWVNENCQLGERSSLLAAAYRDAPRRIEHLTSALEKFAGTLDPLSPADYWAARSLRGNRSGARITQAGGSTKGRRTLADLFASEAKALSRKDPAAAVRMAALLPPGSKRRILTHNMLISWVRSEPAVAVPWAASMPDLRADYFIDEYDLRDGAELWARQDLQGALTGLGKLPPSDAVTDALTGAARSGATEAPEVLQKWAASLDHETAVAVSERALHNWGADIGILFTLANCFGAQNLNDDAIHSLAFRAGAKEPAKYASWVRDLPDTPRQNWSRQNFARNWSKRDPTAASEWISTLPPGTPRSYSIAGFVTGAAESGKLDLPAIERWIAEISPLEKRAKTQEKVAHILKYR